MSTMKVNDYGLWFTISGLGSWPILLLKSWLTGRTAKSIRISKHGRYVGVLNQETYWVFYSSFPSETLRTQEFLDMAEEELLSRYPEIRRGT